MKKALLILFLFFTSQIFGDEHWETRTVRDEQTDRPIGQYTYIDGYLRVRCFYFYDDNGNLAKEITDNGTSENPDDCTDVTERVETTHNPDGTTSSEIVTSVDESTEKYYTSYFQGIVDSAKDFFHTLVQSGYAKQEAFYIVLRDEAERLCEWLIGPTAMRMIGNNTRPALIGAHGRAEINDKVRISFTNGIMNAPSDHEENLIRISQTHGHTRIHYVFRQFDGWNHDILRCTASKLGIISNQSKLIAKQWKELIEEMGGTSGGGTIIHYAHSIGGTETNNAKYLMTEEELKMIHVFTIGSPTQIPNRDFAEVVNFVSKRDGVAYIDLANYFFWGLVDPNSNIVYVGTIYGVQIVDHPLTTDTYREVMEKLGERFLQKYGPKKE